MKKIKCNTLTTKQFLRLQQELLKTISMANKTPISLKVKLMLTILKINVTNTLVTTHNKTGSMAVTFLHSTHFFLFW